MKAHEKFLNKPRTEIPVVATVSMGYAGIKVDLFESATRRRMELNMQDSEALELAIGILTAIRRRIK